jgi:flavin-dependent dehydrogenase
MKFDAVIVGARCAGAATAMLLARSGARVLVVDRAAYGADTVSTHALMRGAVLQLHRWGVLPSIVAAGTPPVHSTTFSYSDEDITVPIEPRHGVSALYAPRRALLDKALVDAAADSGAEVRHGVRVDNVIVDECGRVRGIVAMDGGAERRIEADIVVGADGLHSTIARCVGAKIVMQGRHAAAVLYGYWKGLPTDGYYWAFRPDVNIGAIPTNNGATCVFVSVAASRFHREVQGNVVAAYHRLMRSTSPAFEAALESARRPESVRGFGGYPGFIRTSTGAGWALVGDAGYFKDPATAHGITDALRDAELLARAIVNGTQAALAEYESTRNDLSRRLFEVTDEIASFDRNDAELRVLHRAFSSEMSREVGVLAALQPFPGLSLPADARRAV